MDSKTEVLTATGWRGIDSLTPSDRVAHWKKGRIWFERPKEIIRWARGRRERVVAVQTRQRDIRVSEHQPVRVAWGGGTQAAPAHDLVGKVCRIRVSGMAAPARFRLPLPPPIGDRSRYVARVALVLRRSGMSRAAAQSEAGRRYDERKALRHKNPHQLTALECRLLGFWQGDGSVAKLKHGGRLYLLDQSESNPRVIAWIDETIDKLGLHSRRYRGGPAPWGPKRILRWTLPRGTGFGPRRKNGVFALEPYLVRGPNPLLWGLNETQFTAYMQGLWLADGDHVGFSGSFPACMEVRSVDQHLFDDLQAIAVCRRYRAALRPRKIRRTEKTKHWLDQWVLRVRKCAWATVSPGPSGRRRGFFEESGWMAERMWAIRTDSGGIVTRRNGRVVVLGG